MKLTFSSHWCLKEVSLGSSECVGLLSKGWFWNNHSVRGTSQRLQSRATWGWLQSRRINFTSDSAVEHLFRGVLSLMRLLSEGCFGECWWPSTDLQLGVQLYIESESSNRKMAFLARDPRAEAKGAHFRTSTTLTCVTSVISSLLLKSPFLMYKTVT